MSTNKGLMGYIPKMEFSIKYVLIILAVALLIAAAVYVYYVYLKKNMKPTYVANKEFINEDDDDKVAEILFFTVDWCPHCKKSKPIWDEFSEKYQGKKINGYEMKFKEVNCTDESDENVKKMVKDYSIEGYPTIKMVKDNTVFDYEAKPTMEHLEQWVQVTMN